MEHFKHIQEQLFCFSHFVIFWSSIFLLFVFCCFIYSISSLLLFLIVLSQVVALSRNTEKNAINQSTKPLQKWSKEFKSDNFRYPKVGRAITKWGAIEKYPILLSQYWKNNRVPNIILHFGGTNNIFVDSIFVVEGLIVI